MIVGYLTIALGENVSANAARHVVDEIAGYAINLSAVDAVKCDVGVLDGGDERAFWREADEVS